MDAAEQHSPNPKAKRARGKARLPVSPLRALGLGSMHFRRWNTVNEMQLTQQKRAGAQVRARALAFEGGEAPARRGAGFQGPINAYQAHLDGHGTAMNA